MKKKLIAAIVVASSVSLMAGCTANPNKTAQERADQRNLVTVVGAIGGALAANALGVDSNLGRVAAGALTGVVARKVYDDIQSGTASDPNTDVSAVQIDGKEYVQINVRNVNFRSGSAQLEPYELTRLRPVLDALQRYPNTRIYVEGHTDSDGSHEFNQQLSVSRAQTVSLYLMNNGIARNRVVSSGFGESRPIASNDTSQGKRMNRRVTFLISES